MVTLVEFLTAMHIRVIEHRYRGLPAHYQLVGNRIVADWRNLQTCQIAVAGNAHPFHLCQRHLGEGIQPIGLFIHHQTGLRGVRLAA